MIRSSLDPATLADRDAERESRDEPIFRAETPYELRCIAFVESLRREADAEAYIGERCDEHPDYDTREELAMERQP